MQPDLQGLEITKGELKHLTGVDTDEVFRPSLFQKPENRFNFLFNELLIGLALTPIICGFVYTFIILPTLGYSIIAVIILLIITPILVSICRWIWVKKRSPKLLINLLDEVDKYNSVIKAIHIHDQLKNAGTMPESLSERENVIAGLQLTREDLVRALRTERILRDNKDLIAKNCELFNNNLAAVRALQVSQEASEYGQLLNEALQIGVSVQEEFTNLALEGTRIDRTNSDNASGE